MTNSLERQARLDQIVDGEDKLVFNQCLNRLTDGHAYRVLALDSASLGPTRDAQSMRCS